MAIEKFEAYQENNGRHNPFPISVTSRVSQRGGIAVFFELEKFHGGIIFP
jgi:hypothetical protein